MQLDRIRLRSKLPDPVAVVKEVSRLGYCRGVFENGLEVITTPDGSDWLNPPSYTMRQAKEFLRVWMTLPEVDMGR